MLKINNDLERIGDLAKNISKHSIRILNNPLIEKTFNRSILEIYTKLLPMLKDSLDSIANLDADRANKILIADDEVERLHRGFAQKMIDEIKKNSDKIEALIHFVFNLYNITG